MRREVSLGSKREEGKRGGDRIGEDRRVGRGEGAMGGKK